MDVIVHSDGGTIGDCLLTIALLSCSDKVYRSESKELAHKLINEYHLDVNALMYWLDDEDISGMNQLHFAAMGDNFEAVQFLIQGCDADVSVKSTQGLTAYDFANNELNRMKNSLNTYRELEYSDLCDFYTTSVEECEKIINLLESYL